MERFQRWVSLGSYCLPKFQINRYIARNYYGLQSNDTKEAHSLMMSLNRPRSYPINGGSSIFDWTVVEDYDAVINQIERSFDGYELRECDLEEVRDEAGNIYTIRCRKLGVHFPHLFSSDNSYSGWRSELEILWHKADHLIRHFIRLDVYSTLYVIVVSEPWANSDYPQRLADAIATARKSSEEPFKILVCVEGNSTPQDTNTLCFKKYEPTFDFPNETYLGCAETWDRMFEGFGLTAPLGSGLR